MKRVSNRHQPRLITEMSVTPLLDLVFVLLFVFMVAAPLLKSSPEVNLAAAPAASKMDDDEPGDVVELAMTADLSLSLEGKALARADLGEALQDLLATRPHAGVVVRMDRQLSVEHLIDLMGALEAAGVKRTAVAATAGEAAP